MTTRLERTKLKRNRRAGSAVASRLAAISLYLLVLAVVIVIGVVNGRTIRPCSFSLPGFLSAGAGLLRLLRWAWRWLFPGLPAGAYNIWFFWSQHQLPPSSRACSIWSFSSTGAP